MEGAYKMKSTFRDITITRNTEHGMAKAWKELAGNETDAHLAEQYRQQAEHWGRMK